MPNVMINGEEIDEYTYKLTDPRNVFTQPKEVTGVDIEELLARSKQTSVKNNSGFPGVAASDGPRH